jgi:transposase InsO family protein
LRENRHVEAVLNRQRLHSALDYLTPEIFELAQRSVLPHAAAPIVRADEATLCV